MTGLRRSIMLMVVYLAVFFNIERLDYSGQNLVDLQTFVYVLVTTAILSTLYLRLLQKLTVPAATSLWLSIYMALKLLLFHSRPLVGGIYTYLSITEATMISVAVLLTYDLSRSLNEMEGVAAKVVFPKRSHRVKDIHEADEDIKTEFIRSRRHNRPLSVMIVKMDPSMMKNSVEHAVHNIQHAMMTRYMLASLAQILAKEARRTDMILDQGDQDGFILLCPETTAEGATILAERIETLAQEHLGITVRCGAAAFPGEALTFEELLQKARCELLNSEDLGTYAFANPRVYSSPEGKKHIIG